MAIPPEFIEDLRQRISLSDVIGKRVKLIRKGRRYTGICPFHSEKTPSFSVVDDDGFYHCFGCGAHGDAISFLRETDGLDFIEAVERLADMAGILVPQSAPQDSAKLQQRKATLDILETDTQSQIVGRRSSSPTKSLCVAGSLRPVPRNRKQLIVNFRFYLK